MYYRIGFPDELVLAVNAHYNTESKEVILSELEHGTIRFYMDETEWQMFMEVLTMYGWVLLETDTALQEANNCEHWWYRVVVDGVKYNK